MTTEILIHQKFTAQQAIKAMITGIEKSQSGTYENFELSMDSFGDTDGSICYGCAATVALQELTGYIFPPETYSDKYIDTESDLYTQAYHKAILNHELAENYSSADIAKFEQVVNDFRLGYISTFFMYFNEPKPKTVSDWHMENYNIREELLKIKAFYNKAYT